MSNQCRKSYLNTLKCFTKADNANSAASSYKEFDKKL